MLSRWIIVSGNAFFAGSFRVRERAIDFDASAATNVPFDTQGTGFSSENEGLEIHVYDETVLRTKEFLKTQQKKAATD